MKTFTFAFYLLLVQILAITPSLTVSASSEVKLVPYRIELDDSARIIPFDVRYQRRNDGLLITGRIKKRGSYRGRMIGHVDIHLLDDRGEIIIEEKAFIYGRSPTPRNPDKAWFSVTLDRIPAELSTIRVWHHFGG